MKNLIFMTLACLTLTVSAMAKESKSHAPPVSTETIKATGTFYELASNFTICTNLQFEAPIAIPAKVMNFQVMDLFISRIQGASSFNVLKDDSIPLNTPNTKFKKENFEPNLLITQSAGGLPYRYSS